jgi:hypothetical protein
VRWKHSERNSSAASFLPNQSARSVSMTDRRLNLHTPTGFPPLFIPLDNLTSDR